MRETLTALAIVLILLLTAALAAPYFIDWNAQRAFVEARLSQALGQKVTIGGAIDLKLLPTPYLILDQAVVGADDAPVTLGIRHLALELSVAPLMHGAFEVVEARLDQPIVRVNLQRDRNLPPLPDAPALRADVRFDRIIVSDGTLAVADPASGRTFVADHLDLEAEVESLAGPYKGHGAAGATDARTPFRFATSTGRFGRTRLKLAIEETARHAGFDCDGTLEFTGLTPDSLRQIFDGTAAAHGHVGDMLMPWRLSGPVHADPLRLALADGELRLGGEDHGLLLAATGEADFKDIPRLAMTVTGKQLDADRLFGGGVSDTGAVKPPILPDPAVLRRLLGSLAPPLATTVDLSVESATYGGDALRDLTSTFVLGAEGPVPFRLAGDGPGGVHLALAGTLAPAARKTFDGLFDVAASDVPGLFAWLKRVDPDLDATPLALAAQALSAKGRVAFGDTDVEGTGLILGLDRSSLSGSARFAAAGSGKPALLTADLKAEALDIDALPDLATLRTAVQGTDLDVKLDARAIKVARLADGPLDAGRIRLALVKSGPRLTLRDFRIERLGGATIEATAAIDGTGGTLKARIDADRLTDAAALARRIAPGGVTDAFLARASALAPAKLTIEARLKPDALLPAALAVSGTLGASRIDATLTPDPRDAAAMIGVMMAAAPEGSALLRQIGLPALPLDNLGASRLSVDIRGQLEGSLATTVQASFGQTTIDATGQAHMTGDKPGLTGRVSIVSDDVSPLAQSIAIAFPDLLGRIPLRAASAFDWEGSVLSLSGLQGRIADNAVSGALTWLGGRGTPLSGDITWDRLSFETLLGLALGPDQPAGDDAAWSALPFASALVDPPAARLGLKAKQLDLGLGLVARDASLTLGVSHGLVQLTDLSAHLGDGTVHAGLTLRRDGAAATVDGTISANDVPLDLPGARGTLSGTLDLAGGGRSALALVGSLAGTGHAAIGDLRLPGADPAALPKVFRDVEADSVSVDEDSIRRALDDASAAPLLAGQRAFTLGLAAGVLHLAPDRTSEPVPASPVATVLSGDLDLKTFAVSERIEDTQTVVPKDWSGPPPRIVVMLDGPLRQPVRTLDISGFVNVMAARALARETARIEAYEFDVHERAFFNQRLHTERLKAEDEVRQTQEAARRDEAARKEEAVRKTEAVEAARRAEAEQHAKEIRAAQDREARAAKDRADQDRADQDRAAQDRAPKDRITTERAAKQRESEERQQRETASPPVPEARPVPAAPSATFQAPGPQTDPSAAGRY